MLRLFTNANYKFIEARRINYTITVIALVISIAVAVFHQVKSGNWLNYNVDFTGGTMMQVKFNSPREAADLREAVTAAVPGTEVTQFGGENEFLLRAPRSAVEDNVDETVRLLKTAIGPADQYTIERTESVGPKVGSELQRKALTAVLLSLLATTVYLAFRFEWRFGVAAAIATAHDTILTLGFVSIFRFEVSLTTVAAILTVLGFSLHDTIIIFDRVRENLKKAGRRVDFVELLNRSINETLPRTTLTVLTTLATLASLAIFGGETIRGFATIMFFGILLGAYSSIFVAAPILYEIETRWPRKDLKAGGTTSTTTKPARAGAAV
jgi:preprotein translocase subunit SecF